jgi:hypothetical protein
MKFFMKRCLSIAEHRRILLSALAPLRDCLDTKKCAESLTTEFHGESPPACPSCGETLSEVRAAAFRAGKRTGCSACKRQYSPWGGTPMERSHMQPEDFILLRVALAAGLDHTGCCEFFSRRGQAMTAWIRRIEPTIVFGSAQEDEATQLQPVELNDSSLHRLPIEGDLISPPSAVALVDPPTPQSVPMPSPQEPTHEPTDTERPQ